MLHNMEDTDDIDQVITDQKKSREKKSFVKIKPGENPMFILSGAFSVGFCHWVTMPDGTRRKVGAIVNYDGSTASHRGWSPDVDPLTRLASKYYEKGRELKENGDEELGKVWKQKGDEIRPKKEYHFVVAMGEMVKVKDRKGGKIETLPDFDNAVVGVLILSDTQFENLMAVCEGQFDYMTSKKDLLKHIILVKKGEKNETPTFTPVRAESEPPVDIDPEDYDLDSDFEVDEETLNEIAQALTLSSDVTLDDDDEIEDEGDDDSEGVVASSTRSRTYKSPKAEDPLAGVDFEDDLPDDDPPPTKGKKAAAPKKKAPVAKAPIRGRGRK